jgi:hypothetical protein
MPERAGGHRDRSAIEIWTAAIAEALAPPSTVVR